MRRNIMGDILKEAIADAKAVRETALQNAKMALEEAFTPQLKSMLSAKLREDDMEDEEPADEVSYDEEEDEDPVAETLSINGHTYRLAEEEDEEDAEEMKMDEEEDEDDALDLESVIKELESELSEGEDEDDDKEEVKEGDDEDDDKEEVKEGEGEAHVEGDGHTEGDVEEDEKPEHVGGDIGETVYEIDDDLIEQSDSSDIGKGDNKVDVADSGDEEDPGKSDDKPGDASKGNIGESYKKVKAELKEYKEAVSFLKDKLHEVNILNAKLLFTNKLFKEFVLDNSAKMKVVENFDRAQTIREIKLVYATLAENFKDSSNVKRKSIKESASAKSGSTKPQRKIISEENDVANRFKKLAGLI